MINKFGLHPSAHFRWQRYGLARKFISKSGVDNSLPFSNLSPMEMCNELLNRKLTQPKLKPRQTHAGLGWSRSFVPQVRPDQILGFDTNTRSGVHEMNGKHTPAIRAMVTPTISNAGFKFKSAHNRQGFPTG